MKVLFVIRSLQIFHYYESIVTAFSARGHSVSLLFDKKWSNEEFGGGVVEESYDWAVAPKSNFNRRLLLFSREILSWRRYLVVEGQSSFYAERWLKYVSPKFRFLIKIFPFAKIFIKSGFVGKFLRNFENSSFPDSGIVADIKKRAPDIVLAGPICYRQSSADLEYLKAAKALKIPTAAPVMTWDTLTTKGVFHVIPDLLLAWNEAQVLEAQEHHGIKKENIKIIGAPFFDKWFTPTPERGILSQARSAIPRLVSGVNFPYILYLGSSDNIAPDERWLIKEIRETLDNSEFKNTQIIFRPHPANHKIYKDFEIQGVEILPKNGEMPKTKESFQDFYNMLYYSFAVVSINTSGMVDAILAGKPVISLERKEFEKTQTLAQHYRHMRESNALYVAKTSEEFLGVFRKLLAGDDPKKLEREKFIKTFIRPQGLDKGAGEMAVLEIENLVKNYVKK
ncbi:MAG: hypothetical protein AAB556_02675 [Patescibacteria group bacterium]